MATFLEKKGEVYKTIKKWWTGKRWSDVGELWKVTMPQKIGYGTFKIKSLLDGAVYSDVASGKGEYLKKARLKNPTVSQVYKDTQRAIGLRNPIVNKLPAKARIPRGKGKAGELPPREWFYYVRERILRKLKEIGYTPRLGSPHKTQNQLADAMAGELWWRAEPATKKAIFRHVKKARKSGKKAIITRKGIVPPKKVVTKLGKSAAAKVFEKIGMSPAKIRKFAANPQLMIINPQTIKLTKARLKKLNEDPSFRKALKQYKKFHGTLPATMDTVDLPFGIKNPFMVGLGKSEDVVYQVPGHSGKQSKVPFLHKFGKKPILATDADGKLLVYLQGKFKVKSEGITG